MWQLIVERERSRAAVEVSEARLRVMLQHAADVVAIVDPHGSLTYVSPAATRVLGRSPEALVGEPVWSLTLSEDHGILGELLGPQDDPDVPAVADVRVRDTCEGIRWVEIRATDCRGQPGVDGHVLALREVTDRRQAEEELTREAFTDPLTGLANRRRFHAALGAALVGRADCQPGGARPAVLFCDLDDFRQVNDDVGHAGGDQVLVAVADRLHESLVRSMGASVVTSAPVVARLGGDEFAVLVPCVADAMWLTAAAREALRAVQAPLKLSNGTVIRPGISLGAAMAADSDDVDDLLHAADQAMYRAKWAGKGQVDVADRRPAISRG